MRNYELRIDTSEMKKALDMLSTVVNKKNALPILSCACIKYDRQRKFFTMTACNTEQFLYIECWKRDEQQGQKLWMFLDKEDKEPLDSFCINVDDYKEAFSLPAMPAQCVLSINGDGHGGSLRVNYGKGEFTLPVESGEQYPSVPSVAEKDGEKKDGSIPLIKFSIETQRLLPIIGTARICSANDELRPVLNTVCLDCHHDHAVVFASNGHSFYKHVIDTGTGWLRYGEFPAIESAKLLIPTQAISPMMKTLGSSDSLTLTADNQRIRIETTDGVVFTTVCVDGKCPNYDSVIPKNSPHRLILDRQEFQATLRRVSIFSAEASNMAILKRDDDHVVISASDEGFGRNVDEKVAILNECTLDNGFQLGFKISLMQQLMGCITTDNAIFDLIDASKAIIIKEDSQSSNLTLLIMPMLVNQ